MEGIKNRITINITATAAAGAATAPVYLDKFCCNQSMNVPV